MKKNISRVISCLIVLVLAVSALGIVSVSASDPTIYDGVSVSESLSGTGTEADPYLIGSGADLAYLVKTPVAGAYYKQTADIYWSAYTLDAEAPAASNWTPVADFNGTYDGNGHSICGVYFNDPAAKKVGLFGTASGTIKNLTLKDSAIHAGQYVGGIVGFAVIGTPEAPTALTIENCVNYATVTAAIKNSEIGGIVGSAFSTPKDNGGDMTIVISKCVNYGTIEGKYDGTAYAGGIVGRLLGNNGSIVSECINYGKVIAAKAVAGGIVGQSSLDNHTNYEASHSVTVADCLNVGEITAVYCVGGILGRAYGLTTVKNCVSIGKVSATATDVNANRFNAIEGGKSGAVVATLENNYYLAGSAANSALPETAPEVAIEGAKTLEELNSVATATLLGDKWLYNSVDGLMLVAFATAPAETPEVTTTPSEETTTEPVDETTAPTGENTTEPTEETTTEPVDETTKPVDETTTKTPENTTTPSEVTTQGKDDGKKSCGGVAVAAQVIALVCGALAFAVIKKRA